MSQLSNAVFHVSFRLLQTKNHHLEEKNVKKTTLMNLLTCASLYVLKGFLRFLEKVMTMIPLMFYKGSQHFLER